jgi:hypothetical protein
MSVFQIINERKGIKEGDKRNGGEKMSCLSINLDILLTINKKGGSHIWDQQQMK